MTEPAPAELSPAERTAAESLLSAAWDEPVAVGAAEVVWGRAHVIRLSTRDGRSAILKRLRRDPHKEASVSESFGIELASLEYLSGTPVPVAPRLLGADVTAGVLVMEELPPGRSLADSLLLGDRATAVADLAAYATALGSVHAWSIGQTAGFERARARYSPTASARPWWLARIERGRGQFLHVAAGLGVGSQACDGGLVRILMLLALTLVGSYDPGWERRWPPGNAGSTPWGRSATPMGLGPISRI